MFCLWAADNSMSSTCHQHVISISHQDCDTSSGVRRADIIALTPFSPDTAHLTRRQDNGKAQRVHTTQHTTHTPPSQHTPHTHTTPHTTHTTHTPHNTHHTHHRHKSQHTHTHTHTRLMAWAP